MTGSEEQVIARVRRELARRVGVERCDLWFGPSVTLHASEGRLTVSAPDQFKLDRLLKLREPLAEACAAAMGPAAVVEYAITPAAPGAEIVGQAPSSSEDHAEPSLAAPTNGDGCETRRNGSRVAAASPQASAESGRGPVRRRFADLSSFVVGEGNKLAYTAAVRIVEKLGAVNPVFFFGPSGCGKTHLLEGVWAAAKRANRSRRVTYLSAEQFTSHFLEALPGRKGLPNFRAKHRSVDMLLIDDVQFFLGKKTTLVELFHTVDALLRDCRQIVLAADRPPADLRGLGVELIARMTGGLVCGIEPPDVETRRGILKRMSKRIAASVDDDVLDLLAVSLPPDSRQLAGALHRLDAASHALNRPVSLSLARLALGDMLAAGRRSVRLADIEAAVCEVCGVTSASLQSNRKAKNVSHPRMLAMWLARKYTRAAFSEIGEYFGKRSHATVISAKAKVEDWVASQSSICLPQGECPAEELIRRVEARLRAG